MNLDTLPSIKNVAKLQEYVKNVSDPYSKLAEYEESLIKNNKTQRALVRLCNGDSSDIINRLEGISTSNWYKVSNLANINDIPNNYFDIILWSDCDLESELRQMLAIADKLKAGGRVYFNNLLTDFSKVIKNCVPNAELEKIYGVTDALDLQKLQNYPQIVRGILQAILAKNNSLDVYTTQLLTLDDKKGYIVFVKKGGLRFEPDSKLIAAMKNVDKIIARELPAAKKEPAAEFDKNVIFETITDLLLTEEAPEMIKRELGESVPSEHVNNVIAQVEQVNEQILALISDGALEYNEIITRLPTVLDNTIADKEYWEEYIQLYLEKIMEEKEPDASEASGESKVSEASGESKVSGESGESKAISNIPITLPALRNIGGYSCFMDSVLFSILLPEHGYFNDKMLQKELTVADVKACSFFQGKEEEGLGYLQEFQTALRDLATAMRGGQTSNLTCYPIVQKMKQCGATAKDLMSNEEQDDSEFLIVLMQIFNLEPTTVTITRAVSKDGTNWITTSNREEKPAVLEIPLQSNGQDTTDLLELYQSTNVTNYQNLPMSEWPQGSEEPPIRYEFSSEKQTIKASELLIFHVSRIKFDFTTQTKIKHIAPVSFHSYIQDTNQGSHYELYTVTIHFGTAEGGHYTSYFKYGAQWYYYDDTLPVDSRIRAVTLDEVYTESAHNGSLFFYRPV